MELNLIDKVTQRLIYAFYIKDNINSFDNDKSYKIHFACLRKIFSYTLYDEAIFIISADNLNNPLIKELMFKLSNICITVKKIRYVIEKNNPEHREGPIFEKHILNKLNDYDGITLYFHNKSCQPTYSLTYNENNPDITYWIIGQYYFNMYVSKEWLSSFIKNNNKLIYGWPYMHDNWHTQWLIGGSCYWMKCQDIYEYITKNNVKNKHIMSRTISEYYFPEILSKEQVDYPLSNIIKDTIYIYKYYEPSIEASFIDYLQNTLTYNAYVNFMKFYNDIMKEV